MAGPITLGALSYTTLNPSDIGTNMTLSGGNDVVTIGSIGGFRSGRAIQSFSTGKWYWEIKITNIGSGGANECLVGIGTSAATLGNYLGSDTFGWAYDSSGQKQHGSGPAYGATFTTGDVIGIALDLTAGTITFYKNGISQGVAFTGISGTLFPMVSGGANAVMTCNFGATAFVYTPPTGFSGVGIASSGTFSVTPTPSGLGNTKMTITDSTPGTPLSAVVPVSVALDLEGVSIWVYDTTGKLVDMPTGFISGEFHDHVNGGSGSSTLVLPRNFMDVGKINYDYRVQMFLPDSVDPWYDGYVADFVPMTNDNQDSEQIMVRLEGWQTFMSRAIVSEDLTPSATAGTMAADTYIAHLLSTYLDSLHFGTCYVSSIPISLAAMTEDGAGLNQCIDDVVKQIVDGTGRTYEWWVRSVKGSLPALVVQPSQNPSNVTTGRIAPTASTVPVTYLYDFRDSTTFNDQVQNTGRNIFNMIALYGGKDPATNQQVYGAFKDSTSVSLYGIRQKKLTQSNLLSTTTLANFATAYLLLNAYPQPQRTYQRFIPTDALRAGKWVQIFDGNNGTLAQAIRQMRSVEVIVKIDQSTSRITQQASLTAPLPYVDNSFYSSINQAGNGAASGYGKPPTTQTQNFCVLSGFAWPSSFVNTGVLNVRITPASVQFGNGAAPVTQAAGSDAGNYDVPLVDSVTGATGDGYYEVVFAYDPLTTYGIGSHTPALVCIKGRTPYDVTVMRGWGFTVVGNAIVGGRDMRVFGGVNNNNVPATSYPAPTLSSASTVGALVAAVPGLTSGFTVTSPLNNVPQDGNVSAFAWLYRINGTSVWSEWARVPIGGRPAPPASQNVSFSFPDLTNGGTYDIGGAYVGLGGERGAVGLLATAVATSSISIGNGGFASIPAGFAFTTAVGTLVYSASTSGAPQVTIPLTFTITNLGTGSPAVASWLDHIDVMIAPTGTANYSVATTIPANGMGAVSPVVLVGAGFAYDVILRVVASNSASFMTTAIIVTTVAQNIGGGSMSGMPSAIKSAGPAISSATLSGRTNKLGITQAQTCSFTETDFTTRPSWCKQINIYMRPNGTTSNSKQYIVDPSKSSSGTYTAIPIQTTLGETFDLGISYTDFQGVESTVVYPAGWSNNADTLPIQDPGNPGRINHPIQSIGVVTLVNSDGSHNATDLQTAYESPPGSATQGWQYLPFGSAAYKWEKSGTTLDLNAAPIVAFVSGYLIAGTTDYGVILNSDAHTFNTSPTSRGYMVYINHTGSIALYKWNGASWTNLASSSAIPNFSITKGEHALQIVLAKSGSDIQFWAQYDQGTPLTYTDTAPGSSWMSGYYGAFLGTDFVYRDFDAYNSLADALALIGSPNYDLGTGNITSGVDFSHTHVNKNQDYIPDGSLRGGVAITELSTGTNKTVARLNDGTIVRTAAALGTVVTATGDVSGSPVFKAHMPQQVMAIADVAVQWSSTSSTLKIWATNYANTGVPQWTLQDGTQYDTSGNGGVGTSSGSPIVNLTGQTSGTNYWYVITWTPSSSTNGTFTATQFLTKPTNAQLAAAVADGSFLCVFAQGGTTAPFKAITGGGGGIGGGGGGKIPPSL